MPLSAPGPDETHHFFSKHRAKDLVFRSTKAAGGLSLRAEGSFELMMHLEADPAVESFRQFDFRAILAPGPARLLASLAAIYLCHSAGRFVFVVFPSRLQPSFETAAAWVLADRELARREIWLFSTDLERLRGEPRWSNSIAVAHATGEELHPDDLRAVIAHLEQTRTATIAQIMRLCQRGGDSHNCVLKLVASGVLFADLEEELHLGSLVRLTRNLNRYFS